MKKPVKRDFNPGGALASTARDLIQGSVERRSLSRSPSLYNGACVVKDVSYSAEIVDLSAAGAHLRIKEGLMPEAGSSVELCLMDRRLLSAKVVWSSGTALGIEFDELAKDFGDLQNFDGMGMDFYKSVIKFQVVK